MGERTLAELAQQLDVHANQITQWRSQLLEGAPDGFGEARAEALGPAVDKQQLDLARAEVSWIDFDEAPIGRGYITLSVEAGARNSRPMPTSSNAYCTKLRTGVVVPE